MSGLIPGPIDLNIMIAAWGFRQSHPGTWYEFLDVFLRAVSQKRPLDILVYKEGPLSTQNSREYISGMTKVNPPAIVHSELSGTRRVAVLLRADFERSRMQPLDLRLIQRGCASGRDGVQADRGADYCLL